MSDLVIETKEKIIIIELQNMNLKTYKKLKEEENMEMSFEQATYMIKLHAMQKGEICGVKKGNWKLHFLCYKKD